MGGSGCRADHRSFARHRLLRGRRHNTIHCGVSGSVNRPEIVGAAKPRIKKHLYRLGGNSCLAGDVVGDYSFDTPLSIGDKLVFTDMAHYTMVKTTTFNGVRLPSILLTGGDECHLVKEFGYDDFKQRLS